jgi:hypothetical protein
MRIVVALGGNALLRRIKSHFMTAKMCMQSASEATLMIAALDGERVATVKSRAKRLERAFWGYIKANPNHHGKLPLASSTAHPDAAGNKIPPVRRQFEMRVSDTNALTMRQTAKFVLEYLSMPGIRRPSKHSGPRPASADHVQYLGHQARDDRDDSGH